MATIVLQVTGMKCGGCENSVRDAVKGLAGVNTVAPSFKANTVEVDYDAAQADIEAVKQAIRDKGYAVA
jgi:copper chaperone CopZ